MGLYVDAEAARSALSEFADVPHTDLARAPDFYRALLDVRLAKTLRLVMVRRVTGQEVTEAFNDALEPRLEQAARANVLAGALTALGEFRTHFDRAEVSKGTEIVFSCSPDGRFETSIAGSRRPTIVAPALCWAFFDVYLGERPVSIDAKRSLIAGFPGLLAVREVARVLAPCRSPGRAMGVRVPGGGRRSALERPGSSCLGL
jgi:hypothetical protein